MKGPPRQWVQRELIPFLQAVSGLRATAGPRGGTGGRTLEAWYKLTRRAIECVRGAVSGSIPNWYSSEVNILWPECRAPFAYALSGGRATVPIAPRQKKVSISSMGRYEHREMRNHVHTASDKLRTICFVLTKLSASIAELCRACLARGSFCGTKWTRRFGRKVRLHFHKVELYCWFRKATQRSKEGYLASAVPPRTMAGNGGWLFWAVAAICRKAVRKRDPRKLERMVWCFRERSLDVRRRMRDASVGWACSSWGGNVLDRGGYNLRLCDFSRASRAA